MKCCTTRRVFESICLHILFQVKWHITMDTGWPWQVVLDLWSGNPGRHHQQEVCQDLHRLHQHWRKNLRSLLRHPRGRNSQSLQCQQRWGYPHKEPLQQEHDSPVCQNLPTIHLCCRNRNPTEYPWMQSVNTSSANPIRNTNTRYLANCLWLKFLVNIVLEIPPFKYMYNFPSVIMITLKIFLRSNVIFLIRGFMLQF